MWSPISNLITTWETSGTRKVQVGDSEESSLLAKSEYKEE